MWAKLKKLFAPLSVKDIEDIVEQAPVDVCVGEPILSFVRTVKKDPFRFKCRSVVDNSLKERYPHTGDRGAVYAISDRKLGVTFKAYILQGRLYGVEGVSFSVNGWECRYLLEHLQPIFTARAMRLYDIRSVESHRQRERERLAELSIREEWRKLYGVD